MNDFEFVKELNKEMSIKYQDFVDAIPKPEEIDIILRHYKEEENYQSVDAENTKRIQKRVFQLMRFRTAAVIMEKDDPRAMPMKYEELFGK
jgi:hypothetical protein